MIDSNEIVSQAEVMAYLGFSDEQIDFLLDHDVELSIAALTHEEYTTQIKDQYYEIKRGGTYLVKVDDSGYTDIYELGDGTYRISCEPHLKF